MVKKKSKPDSYGRIVTLCYCPRCEKEHEALVNWQGRGKPRINCKVCKHLKQISSQYNGAGVSGSTTRGTI